MIYHIYRDGMVYDRLFAGPGQDVPYWISLAQEYGDPVLELACGTGRMTIALAREGFQVWGIDNAETMLREARRKASEANVEIVWVNVDMRHFNLGKKFSLIILPNNTLGHLLSLRDFEAFLACVRRHLADGGRFAFDMFVPKMELLLDKPGERFPFSEYDDPYGRGRVVVTESYVYEPHTQIKRVTTHHAILGQGEELEGELTIRMYFPQELDALLKYNGFAIDAKFGDYARAPFDARAEKQLVVCSVARQTGD